MVVENKSVVPVLIPNLGSRGGSPPPSWQRIARDRNTLKLLHMSLDDVMSKIAYLTPNTVDTRKQH